MILLSDPSVDAFDVPANRRGHSSDADSDVLADYVIALLAPGENDDPEEKIRASCLENLEDFLRDGTQPQTDT